MSKLAREELVQQPQDTTEFPYKAILHDKEEKDSQVNFCIPDSSLIIKIIQRF